jgi:quercetin dioxygenase-like cupin family protein
MRRIMIAGVVASPLLLGVSSLLAHEHGRAQMQLLLQRTASWNDVSYKAYPAGQPQLTTVRITIPAHSALSWHTHAMPNAAYLLSGRLTVEDRATGRKAVYRAGEAFVESVGSPHRGVTDSEAAVVIVTYAGTPGQSLSTPVAGGQD